MNILHVIPGLTRERGGPTSVVQALVRHQVEAGHRVCVLTTDQGLRGGEQEIDLHPQANLRRVKVWGTDRVAYAPEFAREVRARLKGCDIVHVHSIFTYPVHVALREALKWGGPTIVRPCGQLHHFSLRQSAMQKRVYLKIFGSMIQQACTAWHYTSEEEAGNSWPWERARHYVLPNGIDPEDFAVDREEAKHQVSLNWPQLGHAPYVLFLGRLHPKKRVDLLVDAFLGGAPAEFKLVVAGPDECDIWPAIARKIADAHPTEKRIVRIGTVGGAKKVSLLAGASWFALPSEHENFGIAALEALAAGTPVLLSPQVDLASSVVAAGHGESLQLEPAIWRQRLTELPASAGESHIAVASRRMWVAERYSWARLATQLEHEYAKIGARSFEPVAASSEMQEK